VAAHLNVGEKLAERGTLRSGTPFIGVGGRVEASVVPHIGDGCRWLARPAGAQCALCSPVPGHWPVALSRVFKPGAGPNWYGQRCSSVQPANNFFSICFNWTGIVNYENHPYVAPEFTKICILIEWKIRNNVSFGRKLKFKTEIELTFLEANLLLHMGQIYWGFKLVWKNLINSPNFLFVLTFQNVNLDCHGCMAKSEVSI
jgi:hypothetical protein